MTIAMEEPAADLVARWILALDGVQAKLEAGATVADVGCGPGRLTILMAQAFPRSCFFGFDTHAPSIDRARLAAAENGVTERVVFEVEDAVAFPGSAYDLVAYFDGFQDLSEPLAAARHAHERLAPDGTLLICLPHAPVRAHLSCGDHSPERQVRKLVAAGGFTRFRCAGETECNSIFQARR